MIVRIIKVKVVSGGFSVSYHPVGFPGDVRATVLRADDLPSGHELLHAGATVDLVLDRDRRVSYVAPAFGVTAPISTARTA